MAKVDIEQKLVATLEEWAALDGTEEFPSAGKTEQGESLIEWHSVLNRPSGKPAALPADQLEPI